MSFGSNLIKLRQEASMSRAELAEKLNMPYSTLRNYEKDQREPGHKLLIQLSSLFSVSVDELIGNPQYIKTAPSVSDEAMKLAKTYDILDSYAKKAVQGIVNIEKARCDESASKRGGIVDLRPFLHSIQPVSAGTGAYLGPEEFETLFVEDNAMTRRASFGVTVRGDSMEPRFHDGDILMVEGAEDIDIGEIGVFTVDGNGYVKKRGDGVLISLNSDYPSIPLTEYSRCNGRVFGVLNPEWIDHKNI